MKVSDVSNLFESNYLQHIYKVYIPSLKKEYSFKGTNVGIRKTIAKSIMSLDDSDYQITKLGLIQSLCLDKTLDINNINEIDFTSILAQIRNNNISEPLTISFKCRHCKKEINYTINFDQIIEKCKLINMDTNSHTIKFNDKINIEFKLRYPSIIEILKVKKYATDNNLTKEDIELLQHYLYINDIIINGEIVEDFKNLNIEDKIKFFDTLPDDIFYDKNNSITRHINKLYTKENNVDSVFEPITCNYCNKIMDGVITNDTFFI